MSGLATFCCSAPVGAVTCSSTTTAPRGARLNRDSTSRVAAWLHERDVAAVCSDNFAIEVYPGEVPGVMMPVHMVLIRDMGMSLGEIFDLEALADDCAADGVWEFLFTAPVLKVSQAVGSPINPLAMK